MNNLDFKIFEYYLSDGAFLKIGDELIKNPNFEINDENITDFVDCKYILDVLKEHKIQYKIVSDYKWDGSSNRYSGGAPNASVSIYISQSDYVSIKYLFETSNDIDNEQIDDEEFENPKSIKNMFLVFNIFFYLFIFSLGFSLIVFGFLHLDEDSNFITLIIMGGIILLFMILYIRKNHKKPIDRL